jgi:hypothetical protein
MGCWRRIFNFIDTKAFVTFVQTNRNKRSLPQLFLLNALYKHVFVDSQCEYQKPKKKFPTLELLLHKKQKWNIYIYATCIYVYNVLYCTCWKAIIRWQAKHIKWFIEDQAFSLSYDLAPPPPSPLSVSKSTGDTQEDRERETTCWQEGRGRGWGKGKITRPQESLALYKSFDTRWWQ